MDDGVGAELLYKPPVRGEVVVGRREVGVVVDGYGVLPEAPRRLDADEHVPESQPSHDALAAVHVEVSRGRAPVLLDLAPQLFGQANEPFGVALRVQAAGGPGQLFAGQE